MNTPEKAELSAKLSTMDLTAMDSPEITDLLILVDATASMSSYLASLKQSLPQIISISALTNAFQSIGLLAYRDYCDRELLEWSGWMDVSEGAAGGIDLVEVAGNLQAIGGGDYPEATKTGLAKAYEVMREDAETLVLVYADAPPHTLGGSDTGYDNDVKEQKALLEFGSYGGHGRFFADWVKGAHLLRNGRQKAQVMCVLYGSSSLGTDGHYSYLSAVTNGACIMLRMNLPRIISEVTVEVLMAWMGVKKEGTGDIELPAHTYRYKDSEGLLDFQSETDEAARKYLAVERRKPWAGIEQVHLTTKTMETCLPKKETPIQDFAKTYKADEKYRALVTRHLRRIIERDVTSISLNPVFGSLWRTFCNDRENDARQEMLDLFGLKVDALKDGEEKMKMKAWLDDSYDYTAEVQEAIERVPEHLRFPCICLDPTLAFESMDGEDDEESKRPITAFRRDELLEIGRSCDWRILRRLGRVLTRLTFIESVEAMPSHLAGSDITKIPMALASADYGRRFWKILLHLIVPGTMLGGRSAALLAALALRMGVKPLEEVAEKEMMHWREKWNDVEIPEIWSLGCLGLILDANESQRKEGGIGTGLLLEKDRELFTRLVEYKMLELNLNTTLHAKIGWTPEKTPIQGGRFVVCKQCEYLRSVTVMGTDGICGLCWCNVHRKPDEDIIEIHVGVEKEPAMPPTAYWYECSSRECRGQYVVYNTALLNVRPKCHYCRINEKAPLVECVKCCSRIIWPEEYRDNEDLSGYTCAGCQAEKKTIVEVEITANGLREENGQKWLIRNENQKLEQPFNNRSLYHAASTSVPLGDFAERVKILPAREMKDFQLRFQGKMVHNSNDLIEELYSWVFQRRTESGTCSLCFSNARKDSLLPACGRAGCQQRVCKSCLEGWYGLNKSGRIVNTAALHCPFCRRSPTPKTLARNGLGVHALGGLADAVANSGEWIYAWCIDCGYAKQYMERVCANGVPDGVTQFSCGECQAKKGCVKKVRACPGCGVETEKTGGCDHMQCPQCETHWCFFCGEAKEEAEIYGHMSREHGGYYGGREYEEEEGEGEVDYEDDDRAYL